MNNEKFWLSRITPKEGISAHQLTRLGNLNPYGQHQEFWKLFNISREESNGKSNFLFRKETREGAPLFYLLSRIKPEDKKGLWEIKPKEFCPDLRNGDHLAFSLRANPVQTAKKERTASELKEWRANRQTKGLKDKTPTKKRVKHDAAMNAVKQLLNELAGLVGVSAEGKKLEVKKRILTAWGKKSVSELKTRLTQTIRENRRFKEIKLDGLSKPELLNLALKAKADYAMEMWLADQGKKKGFKISVNNSNKEFEFMADGYQWNAIHQKGKGAGFRSVDYVGALTVTDNKEFKEKVLFEGLGKAKGFGCGLMLVRRI